MVHVSASDSAEGIPPADSDELRFAVLEALVVKEGTATGQDIRKFIEKTLDLSIKNYNSYHATVSNALIQMSYEGLVDKPFGDMKTGDVYARREWINKYRSGQKDQQVWQITSDGKSKLAIFKASGQETHKIRRSRRSHQIDLHSHASRSETQDTIIPVEEFIQEDSNLSKTLDLTGNVSSKDVAFSNNVYLEQDQHIDLFNTANTPHFNTDCLDISISESIRSREQRYTSSGVFNPNDLKDARERIIGAIVRRRGQPEFRRKLLEIYNNTCIVTGTNFPQALEAAHIISYKGDHTNHVSNGLLLRADIHILFDLRLITIDVESSSLLLAPILRSSSYSELHGRTVNIPDEENGGPSREALRQHKQECGF